MSTELNNNLKTLVVGLLSSLVTSSLVFGFTTLDYRDEVHSDTKDIAYLQKRCDAYEQRTQSDEQVFNQEMDAIKADFSSRQDSISKLAQSILDSNNQLLTYLRVQAQVQSQNQSK